MPLMRKHLDIFWLVAATCAAASVGLFACGSPTGPSGPPGVSGTWLVGMGLSGGSLSCTIDSTFSVSLSQRDTALTGTHTGSAVLCVDSASGQHVSGAVPPGRIVNGTITRYAVKEGAPVYFISFDLDTPESHYTGEISGYLAFIMSGDTGTQKVDFVVPKGAIVLSADWGARMQGK